MNPSQATIIGLGTATLLPDYGLDPVVHPDDYNMSLLRMAVERGVSYIDTAPSYGKSERLLGEVAELLNAHQVRLCTKVSVESHSLTAEAIVNEMEASLSRLRRGSVDTLLLHSATKGIIRSSVAAKTLDSLKRDGRTGLIGVSTYGLEDARLALGMDWCDVVQVEYSIFNQSVVRAIVSEKRAGQEVIVRSVLCKGLLTERVRHAPDLSVQLKQTLDEMTQLAASWGYTLPEIAIRFALDTPGIDVVLVGVSSQAEIDVALRSKDRTPLSPEQMRILAGFDRSEMDCVHPERWGKVSA